MAQFPDAPTYADVIEVDEATGKATFSPVWLAWFLSVTQLINISGGGGGTLVHNDLTGLQGGTLAERFHLNGTNASVLSATPAGDRIIFFDLSAGFLAHLTVGSGLTIAGTTMTASGSGGTVTSVAQTVPSFLAIAGSPVTTTGTLAITLATQAANLVFSGPTTGAAATPTFRALVTADIPATLKPSRVVFTGSSPTITAGGGTGPSIVGKDQAFTVTIGTGGIATTFTVTFANAFTNAPVGVANSDTDIVALTVATTTTTAIVTATAPFTAGSKVHVLCGAWE